jgi:hypothetical protein
MIPETTLQQLHFKPAPDNPNCWRYVARGTARYFRVHFNLTAQGKKRLKHCNTTDPTQVQTHFHVDGDAIEVQTFCDLFQQ